ncbi:MAG: hypothetical protein AAB467_04830 [Patescibacteria group bacterium]
MSFLSQKIQLAVKGTYQWWVIISYLVFGLMAGSLLMSGIFVYNYTFRTLEDAHTIVLLNTDMVVNNINIVNYKKAVDLLKIKSPTPLPENMRNIFGYVTGAAPLSTTSTYDKP